MVSGKAPAPNSLPFTIDHFPFHFRYCVTRASTALLIRTSMPCRALVM